MLPDQTIELPFDGTDIEFSGRKFTRSSFYFSVFGDVQSVLDLFAVYNPRD